MPRSTLLLTARPKLAYWALLSLTLLQVLPCVTAAEEGHEQAPSAPREVTLRPDELTLSLPQFHLDWVPREQLHLIPEDIRPQPNEYCDGVYWSPPLSYDPSIGEPREAPIYASADRYQFNQHGESLLEGNVIIQQGRQQLRSDSVILNKDRESAILDGAVQVREPGLRLSGRRAVIDLANNAHTLDNASYVIHDSHMRGKAKRIESRELRYLELQDGEITSCEPGENTWSLKGESIVLDQEKGWATARNVTLKIKATPVLYAPYLTFPIDDRRKSGFLFPSIGRDDDGGLDISIPYYWNIATNYDATITPRYIANRGHMLDVEFRYLHSINEGQLGLSYLGSDELFGDDRSLLNWVHSGQLKPQWRTHVEYNYVSDDDYLNDLNTNLDVTSQTHLRRVAEAHLDTQHIQLTTRFEAFQTIDTAVADIDLPYRRLPQILMNAHYPLAFDDNLNFKLDSELTYFEHEKNDVATITDAKRFHIEPSLEYQWQRSWAFLKPSATLKHTQYDLDGVLPSDNNTPSRTVPVYSIDSGLIFERHDAKGRATQTLEPRLFWLYVPEKDQSEIPVLDTSEITFNYDQLFREDRFIGRDRVGDAHQVSLGLTSRWLAEDGGEWLRASAGQIFYQEDRAVQLSSTQQTAETPRSAIAGELVLRLNQRWNVFSDIEWNSDENLLAQSSVRVRYRHVNDQQQATLLNFSYRYRSDQADINNPDRLDQSDISFVRSINTRWSVMGRWYFDWDDSRSLETLAGIQYQSCCWSVRLVNKRYINDDDVGERSNANSQIYLQFELKGLGDLGSASDKLVSESILGFDELGRDEF